MVVACFSLALSHPASLHSPLPPPPGSSRPALLQFSPSFPCLSSFPSPLPAALPLLIPRSAPATDEACPVGQRCERPHRPVMRILYVRARRGAKVKHLQLALLCSCKTCGMERDQRAVKVLARLRMGSHSLDIETGQWVRPQRVPKAQRGCPPCRYRPLCVPAPSCRGRHGCCRVQRGSTAHSRSPWWTGRCRSGGSTPERWTWRCGKEREQDEKLEQWVGSSW